VFVSKRVLARGIEDEDWRLAHDSSDIAVVNGVDILTCSSNADLAEAQRLARFDHTIDIPALLLLLLQTRTRLRGTFDRLQAVNFLSRFLLASNRRGSRLLLRFAWAHTLPSKVCRPC